MTEQQIDTPNTIGEIDEKRKIVISTSSPPTGINIEDIRDAVSSKDSNTFPLSKDKFKSTDEVEPFSL